MTFSDSARRGAARATGGAIVVAAGAAGGLLAAHMQADWSAASALELASATPLDHSNDVAIPRPVVVTVTEEEHITPDPVVVVRKVYRWVTGGGQAGTTARSPQRSAAPRTSKSKPSRTVVAPAQKAPAPQPAPASPAKTSKQS